MSPQHTYKTMYKHETCQKHNNHYIFLEVCASVAVIATSHQGSVASACQLSVAALCRRLLLGPICRFPSDPGRPSHSRQLLVLLGRSRCGSLARVASTEDSRGQTWAWSFILASCHAAPGSVLGVSVACPTLNHSLHRESSLTPL